MKPQSISSLPEPQAPTLPLKQGQPARSPTKPNHSMLRNSMEYGKARPYTRNVPVLPNPSTAYSRDHSRQSNDEDANYLNAKDAGDVSDEQIFSEKETIKLNGDRLHRYEEIVVLTEDENKNLKQQNMYLLECLRKIRAREEKVKKLYQKGQHYKKRYEEAKAQTQIVKEQTLVYRECITDLQVIRRTDIPKLDDKVSQIRNSQSEAVERKCHKQLGNLPRGPRQKQKANLFGCIAEQAHEETLQKSIIFERLRVDGSESEGGSSQQNS